MSIQGFAAVGRAVAKFVSEEKITIVAVSDVGGAIYNPNGLDAAELFEEFREKDNIAGFSKAQKIVSGEGMTVPCDILAPCAKEDMITLEISKQIKPGII